MAEVTPLVDPEVVDEIRAALQGGVSHERRQALRAFITYLISEDRNYCIVPKYSLHEIQTRVIETLTQQLRDLDEPHTVPRGRYARLMGKTVRWNRERRFGFIRQASGEPDAFVHINDVIGPAADYLPDGTLVEYEVVPQEKGPKAVNVVPLIPRAGSDQSSSGPGGAQH
jgi:cold shock CspA family protein